MKIKVMSYGLVALLFLGAGCTSVTVPAQEDPETEVIETEETTSTVEQNVRVINGSLLNLSIPEELTSEVRADEGVVYQAMVANVPAERTEDGGLLGDEFVITMKFSTATHVITQDNFDTRYSTITKEVLLEQEVTKGTELSGLRVGYFRGLESGDAVDIAIQAGSDAGIQNATALLQQLEWVK